MQEHKERECGNQVVPEVDDKCIAFASKGEAQQSYMPWVSSKDRTCSWLWEYLFGDLMAGFR